jgi:hypothetical protein
LPNIGATFNALIELPDLEDEYFRNNLTIMLKTASSLLANLNHRSNSAGLSYWELVLDAREDFITQYLSKYNDHLHNKYPEKSEISGDFFLKAKLKLIPVIVFVFDQALDLSIELHNNMSKAPWIRYL